MRKFLSLVFISLFASLGYAAEGGTIAGTITAPEGAPFKAAFVRALNVQSKMTTIVLSNTQWKYMLTHLASSSYEIWATSMGYKTDPAKRSDIKIDGRQTVTLNFTMQKGIVQWNQLTRYQAGMLLPKPTSGPEAKGRDVLLQNCFGCHAMSKWGMRTDHDGWSGAIGVMRTVGVADINPDIAEQAATYLASVFGPDSDTPSSPAQLPDFKSVM